MDYLVQERDEYSHQIYKLRIKLAEVWNLKPASDAEKVREVCRIIRDEGESKSYSKAVKNDSQETLLKGPTTEVSNANGVSTDLGINVESLEKLIEKKFPLQLTRN